MDAAVVRCPVTFDYSRAPGATLTCTYSALRADASNGVNTATVTVSHGDDTVPFEAQAAWDFGQATIDQIDECIDVTDDKGGFLGTVCADQLPVTCNYSMYVGPYAACGTYEFQNTAAFTTNDSGTGGSDSWIVFVDVPCGSCTLTPGYWKTHGSFGPAPYDDTWALLPNGADTPFYLSGQSYYEVRWTSPRGNPYYILAHAFIAARLNGLNGADLSAVTATMTNAEGFFTAYTPSMTLTRAMRAQVLLWATTLDDYNNGLIGPGHCSE